MKFACFLIVAACWPRVGAAEPIRAEFCRKGEDERRIEIVAPGKTGAACDVVYTRENGANVATPYHANVDSDFCRARAAELAARLVSEGFACSTAAADDLEESLAGGPLDSGASDSGQPLNVQLENLIAASAGAASAAIEEPRTRSAAAPAEDFPTAVAGPVLLAADAQPSAYQAPRPPRTTGAGRLVAPRPAIDDIIDANAESGLDARAAGDVRATPPRSTDEVVRSVLAASAAAWNEGNLDAYMGGYANTPDLTVIRDAVVTTGWKEVKTRLEQEIADGAEWGRLSFDALDVNVAYPEIATVVGRYRLERTGAVTRGVTTLVLKQIDSRWRIIQDARIADSVADAQSTE